jgi:hypothetical protein
MSNGRIELSDNERRVLINLLGREIQTSRIPMSESVRQLKHIRAKLLRAAPKARREPEPKPAKQRR